MCSHVLKKDLKIRDVVAGIITKKVVPWRDLKNIECVSLITWLSNSTKVGPWPKVIVIKEINAENLNKSIITSITTDITNYNTSSVLHLTSLHRTTR